MPATRPRACVAIGARVNLVSSPTPESSRAATARAGPGASALVQVSALLAEPQIERACANSEVEKEEVMPPLPPGTRLGTTLKNSYRRVKRVPEKNRPFLRSAQDTRNVLMEIIRVCV